MQYVIFVQGFEVYFKKDNLGEVNRSRKKMMKK